MIDRRNLIAGAAGLTAFGTATTTLAEVESESVKVTVAPVAAHSGKRLLNEARAIEVMEQAGVRGLIAASSINLYYAANTMPTLVKMGWEHSAFATIALDRSQPDLFITSAFQTWDIANGEREVPHTVPFGGVANWQDFVGATDFTTEAKPATRSFPVVGTLTEREAGWSAAQDRVAKDAAPSPIWGLVRALKETGLDRGRVGLDDMALAPLLTAHGLEKVEFVPASNLWRRIRLVKSQAEMALIRTGAKNNAAAAFATMRGIEPGMTYADIERRFMAEAGARGNQLVFMVAGMSSGLLPHGEIVAGEPILVDCVSSYQGYMGDMARTVIVGDPPKDVQNRAKANMAGREAALALVKPGAKYSEISAAAKKAMMQSGIPEGAIIVNPHSVGLQHTDEPLVDGLPFSVKEDLTLTENMTITIDLPYLEIGWGAGHNEDMIRVAKDGFEFLNTDETPLVVV